MITWCALFGIACLLILIYLDDTYEFCRPWLAALGVLASMYGMVFGGNL